MASTIKLTKSSVPGRVPTALDLDYGELAINYADEKVYFKNSSDVVRVLSGEKGDTGDQGDDGPAGPTGPGVPAGGTAGQFLTKSSSTDYASQWVTYKPFPSGTRMLFAQTTAPTGWVKDTTHDNKALRVVSGTAGQGGTYGFTSMFTSRSNTATVHSHALTVDQMPSHGHKVASKFVDAGVNADGNMYAKVSGANQLLVEKHTFQTGGNAGHSHGITVNNVDFSVAYVDVIIATIS